MDRNAHNRMHTVSDIKESFILLFSSNRIEKISVQQICEKAGVSRTLFYQYFDDKYHVLESIENELLGEMLQINKALPKAQLDKRRETDPFPLFIDTAQYVWQHRQIFRALLKDRGDSHFMYLWKRYIREDISRKILHDKSTTYNIDVVSEMLASAMIGLYSYWLFENPSLTYEDISRIGGNVLFSSFYDFIK